MKKLIAMMLALVMVLSLMPASAFEAMADEIVWKEVTTHGMNEIQYLLRSEGNIWITLNDDVNGIIKPEYAYEDYLWNDRTVWAKVGQGMKVIDLNGHRLYLSDEGGAPAQSVMFEVPAGVGMTIYDNVGTGMIWYDGQMKSGEDFYGNDGILVRDVFAVTGGNLLIYGGEIHAGRAKEVWCNFVSPNTCDWDWGDKYSAASTYCGYATKFNSGTAVTVESGTLKVEGGELWGRGWDNISIISRVPNNGAGADGHRDRCAAVRVLDDGYATINGGSFYGRSDADAIQVEFPSHVNVTKGYFDVSTNEWLVTPQYEAYDFAMMDDFEVTEGWLGNHRVPSDSIDIQSGTRIYDKNMTVIPRDETNVGFFEVIDQLGLAIDSPMAYETAVTDINEVDHVPAGVSVKSVVWYENGSVWENPEISYFKEGCNYSVAITLHVDDITKTKFQRELSSATINGIDAMVLPDAKTSIIDRTQAIILMADFGPCKAPIEEVSLSVTEPKAGQTVDYTVVCGDDTYKVITGSDYTYYRRWYVSDNGQNGWKELEPGDRYVAGKYYRLYVDLSTRLGEEFAVKPGDDWFVPDVDATVNGENANVLDKGVTAPSNYITVWYDFGRCPETVDSISLNVKAPEEGEEINYSVTCDEDSCYAVRGTSDYTDFRQWYESEDGEHWRVMDPGETFRGNYYYRFVTDIRTNSGYAFATYDDGTRIMPDVTATVNGGTAKVTKAYEQDPSRHITVEYNFGICNDSVIEMVMVEDLTAPVAGQKPDYSAIVLGNGYHIDTTKEVYYDDYMHGQKLYYIRNGIGWYDLTEDDWIYENETFIEGHEYEVVVYLLTEEGYNFTNYYDHDAFPIAIVNGEVGYVNEGWSDAWSARVCQTFVAEADPMVFTDVHLNDYYYEPVLWAVDNGITDGETETTFNPKGLCLRAHVVTFLHRAVGSPVPPTDQNPFIDVKETDYFYKPVLWAVARGVTDGISYNQFGSYDVCKRGAVVTFLWRAMGSPEPQTSGNPFVDVDKDDYFYKPVIWAVENGITDGIDDNHFGPDSPCNRGQVVTFLYRTYNG